MAAVTPPNMSLIDHLGATQGDRLQFDAELRAWLVNLLSDAGTPEAARAALGLTPLPDALQHLADAMVSSNGLIIMQWDGTVAQIPAGFALCNGGTFNGKTTPDMRNKFVVGAGSTYSPGATGGYVQRTPTITVSGSVGNTTLSVSQLPFHKDKSVAPNYGGGSGFCNYSNMGSSCATAGWVDTQGVGGGGSHGHSLSVSATSSAVDTLPPYYAVCFICYVGVAA